MLTYSRGRNIHDNCPRQVEVKDFTAFLANIERDRAKRKEGAAYICGGLNGDGRRCAEGAIPRRWLAVDLDRIATDTFPDVRLWFAGRFSGAAWPTHSSTPQAPRERVIVELDRDASRSECIAIGHALAHDLATEFGDAVLVDESTFRPEQPVFVAPTGVLIARFEGDPLPVDRYLQAAKALPTPVPVAPRVDPATGEITGKLTEGKRHAYLVRWAAQLNWRGIPFEAVRVALQAENLRACEPPKTEGEVDAIARDILARYAAESGRDLHKPPRRDLHAAVEEGPAGTGAPAARGQREANAAAPARPRRTNGQSKTPQAEPVASSPSEDAVALAFVELHNDHRFVVPTHQWLRWDGQRWCRDSAGRVYQRIRELVRSLVQTTKAERTTANAAFVSGVERLLRTDPHIALVPEQLDADPWALNTRSGIVDLRTGVIAPHDPARLCTRITGAAVEANEGAALWRQFLNDITQGNTKLAAYLQRVAGYGATGATSEDVLVYLFGIGANGKGSFAEAVAHALGDYAKMFSAEVLMESKGERHPTDLAQFQGVRFALTSEPGSGSAWNDARVKALTGDTVISARFMRGDFFEFARTHKTLVLGNHMPRLAEVTHAIRRRVQMVPFRAVFEQTAGAGMRERLKAEASGAILAWIVDGARAWLAEGTAPPAVVRAMTADYLDDQDLVGQWLAECCERDPKAFELSGELHRDYSAWCERNGTRPKSNVALSATLVSAGFEKRATSIGKVFYGLRRRAQ